jgi:tight adherence protein C
MPTELIVLLALLVAAIAAATYALVSERQRRAVLWRAGAGGQDELLALKRPRHGLGSRIAQWLVAHTPSALAAKQATSELLVQAGWDTAAAPVVYAIIRLAAPVLLGLFGLLGVTLVIGGGVLRLVVVFAVAVLIGLLAPPALLNYIARARQNKMRRALPDSLDLLLVCVEAGISLDAAILRVAREMALLHPDLANEFMVVNRRVNAGMPREQALHGLWERTGVEELRGLVANMIQSEKWGTSIATVLRVYAETLRRNRKQAAEKKAATAPVKMLFPMTVFILPALFVVILGPAAIKIVEMFRTIKQ